MKYTIILAAILLGCMAGNTNTQQLPTQCDSTAIKAIFDEVLRICREHDEQAFSNLALNKEDYLFLIEKNPEMNSKEKEAAKKDFNKYYGTDKEFLVRTYSKEWRKKDYETFMGHVDTAFWNNCKITGYENLVLVDAVTEKPSTDCNAILIGEPFINLEYKNWPYRIKILELMKLGSRGWRITKAVIWK
jgi:hypothetical protein